MFKFMNLVKFSSPVFAAATPAPAEGESVTGILNIAQEMFTWILNIMGDLVAFIFAHPGILIFLGITFVSFGVGMFFRVWRKARN